MNLKFSYEADETLFEQFEELNIETIRKEIDQLYEVQSNKIGTPIHTLNYESENLSFSSCAEGIIKLISQENNSQSKKSEEGNNSEMLNKSINTNSLADQSQHTCDKSFVKIEKASKNENLATREDVVNKTILRCLKRFYLRKLYELGKNINRRNFKKNPTREIIDTLKETSMTLFGTSCVNDNLIHFLLIILRLKPNKKIAFDKDVEEKGLKVASCMYKYSNLKFSELFAIKELKFLFNFMIDNFYDEVIELEKTIKANQNKYEETIQIYKAKFDTMVIDM